MPGIMWPIFIGSDQSISYEELWEATDGHSFIFSGCDWFIQSLAKSFLKGMALFQSVLMDKSGLFDLFLSPRQSWPKA